MEGLSELGVVISLIGLATTATLSIIARELKRIREALERRSE